MILKIIMVLLALSISISSFAAGTGIYSVTKVGCTTSDGSCWISLSPPVSTTINDCTSGYEVRFMLGVPESNALLSLALAAQASNKSLEIYIQDGTSCIGAYPKAVDVSIIK